MGPTKFSSATNAHKAKCQRTECNAKNTMETVTHAFMECPTARTAVEAILKRWEYTTGEQLDPTNEATILFGDREANLKLPSQALDEPFRVMHMQLSCTRCGTHATPLCTKKTKPHSQRMKS